MERMMTLLSACSNTLKSVERLMPEKSKDRMRYWPGVTLPALTSSLTSRSYEKMGMSQQGYGIREKNRKEKKKKMVLTYPEKLIVSFLVLHPVEVGEHA